MLSVSRAWRRADGREATPDAVTRPPLLIKLITPNTVIIPLIGGAMSSSFNTLPKRLTRVL